jgi:hypothetical protein
MKCPFCDGAVHILNRPRAVMHTVPQCKKFMDEDPLVFLRNLRLATVGPVAGDEQWPIAGADDDKTGRGN